MTDVHNTSQVQRTTFVRAEVSVDRTQQRAGLLGSHRVEVGEGTRKPATETNFGDKVKSFFKSVGQFFSNLGDKISSGIATAKENHAISRAQSRVDGWETSSVDARSNRQVQFPEKHSPVGDLLGRMGRAKEHFGAVGMHQMTSAIIEHAKHQATLPTSRHDTWQGLVRENLLIDLLKKPNLEEAGRSIDELEAHFKTYEKAGRPPELVEMSKLISGLRAQVTDVGKIEETARSGFTQNLDTELNHVDSFFRSNNVTTLSSSSLLRNLNSGAASELLDAFRDMLTDPKNKDDVELLKNKTGKDYSEVQMQALNRLTSDFLERAFGLSKDGGKAFAEKFDPTVLKFLQDTGSEIAGKGTVSVENRNEAIRSWFSNGIALRDFGMPATNVGKELGLQKLSSELATHVLRVVADVQAGGILVDKMGPDGMGAYGSFISEMGPKMGTFLGHLGMPVAT